MLAHFGLDRLHRFADQMRHAVHRRAIEQRLDVGILDRILHGSGELGAHFLRDGEIAGTEQRDRPLARLLIREGLAEHADIVESGIGPRVGQHHEPGLDPQSHAISHQLPPSPAGTVATFRRFTAESVPEPFRLEED